MTSKTTNSVDYKRKLLKLLKELNYFSDIQVFFGANIDTKKLYISDLATAPALAICFPGGALEEKSKSQGPYTGYDDTNEIYFFIMGPNNSLDDSDDFAYNSLELEDARDLMIRTIKQNKDYWGLTNNDFNFIRYSYLNHPDFETRNVNVMVIEASHKYKFL